MTDAAAEKVPHIYKRTKESLTTTGFDWGYMQPYSQNGFDLRWSQEAKKVHLDSPLDQKARDFVDFYFSRHQGRSLSYAALGYGIDRQTASRHMKRLVRLGWVQEFDEPIKAGKETPPRVYLRKVFWSDDFWNDSGNLSNTHNDF